MKHCMLLVAVIATAAAGRAAFAANCCECLDGNWYAESLPANPCEKVCIPHQGATGVTYASNGSCGANCDDVNSNCPAPGTNCNGQGSFTACSGAAAPGATVAMQKVKCTKGATTPCCTATNPNNNPCTGAAGAAVCGTGKCAGGFLSMTGLLFAAGFLGAWGLIRLRRRDVASV